MRDITLEATFYQYFSTRAFATGVPTTLAGTPVISAYEDDNLTQITAGVSLTVDFDGVAGLHLVTVVATSGNGFESGKSYALVITTGTVGGVSVVGEVVGEFTIGQSAAAVDLANATDGLSALKALIDTLDDFVDTEIAAIKAKTDLIGATVALEAGGNIASTLSEIQHATYGLAAIETLVDELESRLTALRAGYLDELAAVNIPADVDSLLTRIGTPSNLGSGATIAANLADIESQTDDIGVAGEGLTGI